VTCARSGVPPSTGETWCWGWDLHGELGRAGDFTGCTSNVCGADLVCADPACTTPLFGARGLTSGGWDHVCAVNFSDELVCWGLNSSGQIGDGSTANALWAKNGTGIEVHGTGNISEHMALGQSHTCVLTTFGVACWGANSMWQLGDGTADTSLVPVGVSVLGAGPIPTAISASCKPPCSRLERAIYDPATRKGGTRPRLVRSNVSMSPTTSIPRLV
jgi:hypothetical protein